MTVETMIGQPARKKTSSRLAFVGLGLGLSEAAFLFVGVLPYGISGRHAILRQMYAAAEEIEKDNRCNLDAFAGKKIDYSQHDITGRLVVRHHQAVTEKVTQMEFGGNASTSAPPSVTFTLTATDTRPAPKSEWSAFWSIGSNAGLPLYASYTTSSPACLSYAAKRVSAMAPSR